MKVPNKILHITLKLANGTEEVLDDERALVRQWALEGAAKRAAMTDEKKSSSKEVQS